MIEVARRVLTRNGVAAGRPQAGADAPGQQAHQRVLPEGARPARREGAHNIQKYGNTTAATIPLLWDECARDGRIKPGDLVLLVAFGAGMTWGATLVRA